MIQVQQFVEKRIIEVGVNSDNAAEVLKCVIDFEVAESEKAGGNEAGSSLNPDDLERIQNDFRDVIELRSGRHIQSAMNVVREKGIYFLNETEMGEYRSLPAPDHATKTNYLKEKALPKLLPLWHLVISLCRSLQKGENIFTAEDAWWLGLADEVAGSSLPSLRKWTEYRAASKTDVSQPSI
ncbi:MAG: hypothetical protein KIT22_08175 [Verrucomicrobiae bacterium]|nr:hypothetical protein [Verrucomicrobiae bacterium]